MGYTMKQADDTAADIMVEPILKFLREQSPSGDYTVKNAHVEYGEGHGFGNKITIYDQSGNLFRKIFPRKVAVVTMASLLGGMEIREGTAFDKSRISESKLVELLNGVDVSRILSAAAFAGPGADDYF